MLYYAAFHYMARGGDRSLQFSRRSHEEFARLARDQAGSNYLIITYLNYAFVCFKII